MPAATPTLLLIAGALALPQSQAAVETIRAVATDEADSALLAQVADRPTEAREAIRQLLVESAAAPPPETEGTLAVAARIAGAYAAAWDDSSLARLVTHYRGWTAGERQRYAQADSLRAEGKAALYRDGVDVALGHWRKSLALFRELQDSAGAAGALYNIGAAFYLADVFDSAGVYLERARRLARASDAPRVVGNALVVLGSVVEERGDLRRASELYSEALETHTRIGDARGMAADHNNLGIIAEALGDRGAAQERYETALALNRRHGHASAAATNQVNLGNLASEVGDYAEAASRYDEALTAYTELDEPVNAADVLYNLGLLQMRRGDYRAAAGHLSDALLAYERASYGGEAMATRRALAGVHAALGDLQAARRELQSAERHAAAYGADARSLADLALAGADLALRFNQLAEAEAAYARALRLYRAAGSAEGQAQAQQGQATLYLLREEYSAALDVIELALRTQEHAGDARDAAWSRLLAAEAAQQLGDTADARRHIEEAATIFRRLGDPVSEAAALGELAGLERNDGRLLEAESLSHQALQLIEQYPAPSVAWRLHQGLAEALHARGAVPEAAQALRTAIAEIERVAGSLVLEEWRSWYRADKWKVYQQLALLERARGRHAEAFDVSERMRARQMLDLLARGRISTIGRLPRDLADREQDVRRRVAELALALEDPEGVSARLRGLDLAAPDQQVVREALARAQAEYTELLLELRERSPEYTTLVAGETVRVSEIASRLGPYEVLLEYLLGDSTSVVFAVSRAGISSVDLNLTRTEIARLVDFARGALTRPDAEGARDVWRAAMRRLYQQVISPVEDAGLLDGKRRLLIAPHAELHYLPFEALIRQGDVDEFLIEFVDVVYVPSASTWVRLGERHTPPGTRFVAMAPHERTLPGSREEIEAIRKAFGHDAVLLVGSEATEQTLVRVASEAAVLHLATYGVLNTHNPLFSFVDLRPAGEHDGRLEVHEVFGLRLRAPLVVLSACQTGLGSGALADVPPGDDWVGLVRAFLFAGASSVVATLWTVEDEATARLMGRFYDALAASAEPSEALARAKRTLLDDPDYDHPFYWAGFVLVNGGGAEGTTP